MSQTAIQAKPHFAGIDLVKVIAALFVPGIHFFLYSGFYQTPIQDNSYIFPILMRWLTYACVPIFMIVTGYNMKNKVISKKYFLSLIPVLFVYLVASIACAIFNHFHFMTQYTAYSFIKGLFMFTDAQYAWYVEYYLCLYLMIPLINAGWKGLGTKSARLFTVIAVFFISSMNESFFIGPVDDQIRLCMGYFPRLYPIAYYLAGCYIREYPVKKDAVAKMSELLVLAAGLTWLTYTTYRDTIANVDNNYVFYSRHYNDYGAFPVFMVAFSIFLLLHDVQIRNRVICFVLKLMGSATLGCYLISYIYDSIFYNQFGTKYPYMEERLKVAPVKVLCVFGCAMATGIVIHLVYKGMALAVQSMIEQTEAEVISETAAEVAEAAAVNAEQTEDAKEKVLAE